MFKIDTDGDNVPDSYVFGPTNFAAGGQNKADDNCHRGYDAYHCPWPDGSWTSIPFCEVVCCPSSDAVAETKCVTQDGAVTSCSDFVCPK